jgi:hypothetical protein
LVDCRHQGPQKPQRLDMGGMQYSLVYEAGRTTVKALLSHKIGRCS